MKSAVAKRSVVVSGHKTSISLEDAFWDQLRQIARTQRLTLSRLVAEIDQSRQHGNLLGHSPVRTRVRPGKSRTGLLAL